MKDGEKKADKRFSVGKKIINGFVIYLWFYVLALGMLLLMWPALAEDTQVGLLIGSFCVVLSIMRIYRRGTLEALYAYKSLSVGKKCRNAFVIFVVLVLVLVASVLYYENVYSINMVQHFGSVDFDILRDISKQNFLLSIEFIGQMLMWVIPLMFLAILVQGLLLQSIRQYAVRTSVFIYRYVSLFLIVKIILFVVSSCACVVSLTLTNNEINGESIKNIFASYFLFTLQGDRSELMGIISGNTRLFSKTGTLVTSLTGAATYRALTDIAMEHVLKEERTTYKKRFADMIKSKDVALLMIMSFLSTMTSMTLYSMTHQAIIKSDVGICLVFFGGWVFSWILFLKETKVVPYVITVALMYFVESVIAAPKVNNPNWGMTIVIVLIRIMVFACVASLIAHYTVFYRPYGMSINASEEDKEDGKKLACGNIFQIVAVLHKMYNADDEKTDRS